MSRSDDDRFRIRPGTPKQRDDAFINKVLRQTNKAGAKLGKTVDKVGQRPGSRLRVYRILCKRTIHRRRKPACP